ncbi:MAG: YezD family protein [Methylotetracoccus sp.]
MYRKTTSDLHAAPALPLEQRILAALNGLQYGAVEITVHEGKVVQIERREKFRFPTQPNPKP